MVTVEAPDEKGTTTLLDPTGRLSTIMDAPMSSAAFESHHQQRSGRDIAGDDQHVAPDTAPTLLTLPTEIRQNIWKHVYAGSEICLNYRGCGMIVYPTTSHESISPHEKSAEKPSYWEHFMSQRKADKEAWRDSRTRPAIALALVHPSIYQEVLRTLYASTTFTYGTAMPYECGFKYFHPDARARVTSLKINAGLCRFGEGMWKRGSKKAIAGLAGLKKLEYITVARTAEGPATNGHLLRYITEGFLKRLVDALQAQPTGGGPKSLRSIDCTVVIEFDDNNNSDQDFDFSWVPELGELYPVTLIAKRRELPYKREPVSKLGVAAGFRWRVLVSRSFVGLLLAITNHIDLFINIIEITSHSTQILLSSPSIAMWPSLTNPTHKMKPPKNKCTLKNDGVVDPAVKEGMTIPRRAEQSERDLTIHSSARISGRRETQPRESKRVTFREPDMGGVVGRFSSQQKSLETTIKGIDKMRLSKSSTKRSSRLLLLPAEIRRQIWKDVYAGTVIMITETGHGVHDPPESAKELYEQLPSEEIPRGATIWIHGLPGQRDYRGRLDGKEYFKIRKEVENEAIHTARIRPVHSLALVCKSISQEALSAMYDNATFHARDSGRLERFVSLLSSRTISLVKSLQFVGYEENDLLRHCGEVEKKVLVLRQAVKAMSGLEELHCTFSAVTRRARSVIRADAECAERILASVEDALPISTTREDGTLSLRKLRCTVVIQYLGRSDDSEEIPWTGKVKEGPHRFKVIFEKVEHRWIPWFI
ncbi:hypothetical protein BDZ85DRAFT_252576 [Elsinoe ampelina]|uniref:DUF7730 domain-containing protein n=1 Tax=Elsinoe ampelina TaxID=302913 RepID=A0A6A6G2T5_9PEZI|nr:hypothetical protein BDZ85DRAFT_252576 [Elsinoe ampelina]